MGESDYVPMSHSTRRSISSLRHLSSEPPCLRGEFPSSVRDGSGPENRTPLPQLRTSPTVVDVVDCDIMTPHTTAKRIAAMGFAGAAWLIAIISYQHAFRLTPAPDSVQESGRTIIREELVVLEDSPFGHTKRGRLIATEARRLLAEDRVVFAPMTTTRGLTWDPVLGSKLVYVKVIELDGGQFLHQRPPGIMEALVHETVHSIKNTRRRISIEEECDCFAAGMEAAAIAVGHAPPALFTVDGQPVADFVLQAYPKARHDSTYQPVGASLEWLARRTGL